MAISFTAQRGTTNSKVAGATLAISPSATIADGAVAVLRGVCDNIATASGQTTNTTVTDSVGNTWTRLREHTRSSGAAADGVTGFIWLCNVTTAITTSDSVTLTLSASVAAKAIAIDEYAVAGGTIAQLVDAGSADGSGTTPSVTVSGLASANYLFIGCTGAEGPGGDSFTQDGTYTGMNATSTTGSTADTNVSNRCGRRIATLTGDTFNPTLGTSRDYVALLAVVAEVSAGNQYTLTPATSTHTAVGLGRTRLRNLAAAVGTSVAVALSRTRIWSLTPASSTQTAVPLSRSRPRTLTPATQTSTAVPLARQRARGLAPSTGSDQAVPLARTRAHTLAPVTAPATVVALSRTRIRQLQPAIETDTAVALAGTDTVTLTPAVETDVAVPLVRTRIRTLTPATEPHQAVPVVRIRLRTLVPAVTGHVAVVLARLRARDLTPAVETDVAVPLLELDDGPISVHAARLLGTRAAGPLRPTVAHGRLVPTTARGALLQTFNDESRDHLTFEASVGRDLANSTIELKVDGTWYPATWTAAAAEGVDDQGRPVWTRPAVTDGWFAGSAHPDPDGAVVLLPHAHATEARVTWAADGRTLAFDLETLYVL